MFYIESFLFYIFSSSIILVYGIGLDCSLINSNMKIPFNKQSFVIFIKIITSILILWYPINYFIPFIGFQELSPLFIILVCGIVDELTSIFISRQRGHNPAESLFFFGIVFLALAEGASLLFSLIIAISALVGFFLITITLFAIKNKVTDAPVPVDLKGPPLALISMGLLYLIIHAADASWWLSEVLK